MKKKASRNWKKIIMMACFAVFNIAIIAFTAVNEFKDGGDASRLEEVELKWWLMIPAVLCFVLAAVSEIYKYYIVMRDTKNLPKNTTEKNKKGKLLTDKQNAIKISTRTVLLGRYYDNVTPAAVGGQPFQIYFMHKKGVKNGYDAVVPIIGMITDQLGFVLIGVISIVIGGLTNAIWSPAIVAVGWIGLLCFALFPVIILAATFLPKTTNEIMTLAIKGLTKIKIIKNREKAQKQAEESVEKYAAGIRTVLKTPGLFVKTMGLGIVYYAALSSIPFFVLSAFGATIPFFASFATTVAVSAAVYFIPTPGNAGAAEGTFYSVFAVLPNSGFVFWAMLVWRLLVYYVWLILGGVVQLRMFLEGRYLVGDWRKSVNNLEEKVGRGVEETS